MDPMTIATVGNLALNAYNSFKGGGGGGGDQSGFQQRSRLDKSQQPLKRQLINANMNPGAGGSFGTTADYYRDLMSNDSQTMQQMAAPEMRQFNEQIIPDISEQFAGMGSGNLSSSGFRNAAVGAGTDLSERLGAIRANLRMQGAQGLTQLGQLGLGDYTNNTYQQDAPGFLDYASQGIGEAIPGIARDYMNRPQQNQKPQVAPNQSSQFNASANLPKFGKTSPYGRNMSTYSGG